MVLIPLPFEFDQTDPAKIPAMERPDVIIDKPHNVYINMLFGAGIVAFLAFIAIVIMVIFKGSSSTKSGGRIFGSDLASPIGYFGLLRTRDV